KRGVAHEVDGGVADLGVVEDAVAGPDRSAAVAERAIGNADPWREVVLVREDDPARDSLARLDRSRRRSAQDVRYQDAAEAVVSFHPRRQQVVAQAEVQGQPLAQLPVVLDVGRNTQAPEVD